MLSDAPRCGLAYDVSFRRATNRRRRPAVTGADTLVDLGTMIEYEQRHVSPYDIDVIHEAIFVGDPDAPEMLVVTEALDAAICVGMIGRLLQQGNHPVSVRLPHFCRCAAKFQGKAL